MRTDLRVPFADKDEVKNLGAQWDSTKRTWYIENHSPLSDFAKWLPSPLSSNQSNSFRNEARRKTGDTSYANVGNTYSPRPNACDCTLMWECEQCRSKQRLG